MFLTKQNESANLHAGTNKAIPFIHAFFFTTVRPPQHVRTKRKKEKKERNLQKSSAGSSFLLYLLHHHSSKPRKNKKHVFRPVSCMLFSSLKSSQSHLLKIKSKFYLRHGKKKKTHFNQSDRAASSAQTKHSRNLAGPLALLFTIQRKIMRGLLQERLIQARNH